MADLPEVNEWPEGIYQLETSDPVLGGPEGIDNLQGKQLASRTKWLRDQFEKIANGVNAVGKASKLATARAFSFKGAATGSGDFDGSADVEITLTLADSGLASGSYTRITFNSKGLATGGSNPSTLSGYGITDGATKTDLGEKADKATSLAGYGVAFASQPEAEAGADTNKPMNALRVFQAITAKVVQATGSAIGLARLASLVEVIAGTDDATIVTPKKAAALFPFRGWKVFNVTGVYTWTVPAGVTKAWVEVIGGGGGGARSAVVPGPSGGGGGGVAIKLVDLTGVTSVTVTVGLGGPGAVTMEAVGGNGGASAFGGYCSATGGQGGVINGNGSGPGSGIGGDLNFTVGVGSVPVGSAFNTNFLGGCGGGGESTYARADNSPPSRAGHGGGGRIDSAGAPGAAGQVLIRW
ncbi:MULTISPECIES: hypothetical protein [Pseudomonas]|uniref:glycine-rich domain-containing protein n=1 Tax=Pseudomonas TaxID=286 RepID=UPI000B34B619|nr:MULTISPECIES: hypothetical protein [Pseudomonas]PMY62069.1 hypothetical protein C1Y31_23035 [Pseudomonas sp. FW305-25]PNA76514.1 hypothetical protein C1Y33_19770 [Pseudomonas sp. FW305-76]